MMEATGALAQLWSQVGGDPAALDRARLTGADPMLPTNFKIGTAASAVIGATALAAAELWRLRTGRAQSVAVDMRAAIAAFRSERYLRVDGQPPPEHRGAIFGFYRRGWFARAPTGRPTPTGARCQRSRCSRSSGSATRGRSRAERASGRCPAFACSI